jgi:hypothetical protein
MKLIPTLILLYVLFIGIIIFDNLSTSNSGYDMEIYNQSLYNTSLNTTFNVSSPFWEMFMNPTKLADNYIWVILGLSFAAGVGIVLSYVTKSDMFLLQPLFIVTFTAGMIPIISFYGLINREITGIFFDAGSCTAVNSLTVCSPALLIAALIVGPLALYWFWTCMEFLSGRSVS